MTKILIIGSTGKLGSKLVNFCFKNKIKVSAITCYRNTQKLIKQSKVLKSFHFSLSNFQEKNNFIKYISSEKFDLIYFLDFGASSLYYFKFILKNKSKTVFAIANKELLIAGGSYLVNLIKKYNKTLIPLDSEHYSLVNSNISNENIDKVYITASGGPFYFKPNIDLNKVSLKEVLKHPRWSMGINNSIDSSNFINKILEIYELSSIYQIDLNKISFLVSKNAFIHSVIYFKNNITSINCFKNDMIVTLIYPLSFFFKFKFLNNSKSLMFDHQNMTLEKFNDKRFKIIKYFNILKNFNHRQQIQFMILNNLAQKYYLNKNLSYNSIIPFIIKNINLDLKSNSFKSIDEILLYIDNLFIKYDLI
jgi:1-deoxy-D-xylulose-5-phosphate reductoisomerase